MDMDRPRFEVTELFSGERFPNVVVSTDGTVAATWGRDPYRVRRSENGGLIARFNLAWLLESR